MTRSELRDLVRQSIGRPPKNQVEDSEIDAYFNSGLTFLAGELDYRVRIDSLSLVLTAEQRRYPLPDDVLEIVWVEWNSNRLESRSIWEWDRLGTDYVDGTSGNPLEFAVQGRELILFPPPDTGAVETAGSLVYCYLSTGEGITPAGVVGLSDADQRVAAYRAAWEWLLTHPTEQNAALAQGVGSLLRDGLPQALRRAADVAMDQNVRFFPVSRRTGSVR
jgi:hypothetical protein